VGRKDFPVKALRPKGLIVKFIEDKVPAGHTFGTHHDAFVEHITGGLGVPDALVNIPSMSGITIYSVFEELNNSMTEITNEVFDTNFYIDGHDHEEYIKNEKNFVSYIYHELFSWMLLSGQVSGRKCS
jgi:hypothetical protein